MQLFQENDSSQLFSICHTSKKIKKTPKKQRKLSSFSEIDSEVQSYSSCTSQVNQQLESMRNCATTQENIVLSILNQQKQGSILYNQWVHQIQLTPVLNHKYTINCLQQNTLFKLSEQQYNVHSESIQDYLDINQFFVV